MTTKNITKLLAAVALTLAVTFGSGVIETEIELDIVPAAHAGSCASGGGGGC